MDEQLNETWWRARQYSEFNGHPEKVTVVARSKAFIRLEGAKRRVSIESSYENYFPSLEDALDWMMGEMACAKRDAERRVKEASEALFIMEQWRSEASV